MTIKSIALFAALSLTAACGTKEAPGPLEPTGATGRIRFVNLINDPTRLPLNAILESVPFGVNLGYGATTPSSLPSPSTANYSAILAGDRSMVLQKTADPSVTVATLTFTIVENNDHTVYATGGVGGGAIAGFMTTDPKPSPAAGPAAIRIVNMSPAGGTMDFFITAPSADLSAATPAAAALALHAGSPYVNVAAGTYRIRGVPAGTAAGSRAANTVFDFTTPALSAGAGRTVVAADAAAGGSPLRGFLLTDQ